MVAGNAARDANRQRQQPYQQQQQMMATPLSMALAPSGMSSGEQLGAAVAMSPLQIGSMAGLTEQQAAEVAELLTPFLSPGLGRSDDARAAFSPLTSPALAPQSGMQGMQGRQRQSSSGAFSPGLIMGSAAAFGAFQQNLSQAQAAADYAALDFASMPPPSPSITAEHIMRRQQQLQQMLPHSPSFPSSSSPYLAGGRGFAQAALSPHHHPYRASPAPPPPAVRRQTAGGMRSPLGTQQARELAYTPSLLSRSAAEADDFLLDSLPLAPASPPAQPPRSRTLHQLNAPHQQQPAISAQQFASWLDAGGDDASAATPASLMNLPLSAHHLANGGEIVASPSSAIAAALERQQLASGGLGGGNDAAIDDAELLRFVTQSAPMSEFVHPPVPPPLHIGPPSAEDGSQPRQQQQQQQRGARAKARAAPDGGGTPQPRITARRRSIASGPGGPGGMSAAAGRRRSRASLLLSPRGTPLVPSTLKHVGASPGPSPGLAPLTPAIAPRRDASNAPNASAAGTPQLRARGPVVAATSTTNIVGLEADVVTRLATKSNYQNIMEGNSEFLGLSYKSEFKSGLERRRTNHKQAEQKRRDSLKSCFQALKTRLPDLDPKLVSKIYLLNRANAFIDSLARMNQLLADAASAHGVDVAAIAAKARADELKSARYNDDEEDEDDEGHDGKNAGASMDVDNTR
ncbi:hypothetical protein GGI04_002543 [Coemansia thaxteri]|nr:hypothetical protein GGI04_002543 [Coemansia thaxteri]KAJ2472169.1 hypothetical protein GGI02_001768 [Coemansia sp. RSA 2322]